MSNGSDPDLVQFKTALGLYIKDPWERVLFIFKKNAYGEWHPDLNEAYQIAEIGLLCGTTIGGVIEQRKFLENVKERSDAKIYHHKMDAYRQMTRESFQGFLNGAFKWGPRMAIFMGGFKLFASCVEAYRNKPGVIEYSIGGTAVGCFLKWNFGIRGMLVGSLVGMVLGSIYGIAYFGICSILKKDSVEIKYGQYAFSKYLNEKATAKFLEKKGQELGISSQINSEQINPLNNWTDDKVQ